MALPDPLTIGTELWGVAPYTDDDTGEEMWEPVRTKVHWMEVEKVDGEDELFINDCHASMFFDDYDDAFLCCVGLMENTCDN